MPIDKKTSDILVYDWTKRAETKIVFNSKVNLEYQLSKQRFEKLVLIKFFDRSESKLVF